MKKPLSFLFLAAIMSISSCTSDPDPEVTTSLNLNFSGTYAGELLLMFKEYEYADGNKIQFNKFNFFVSEIALVSTGTDESKTDTLASSLG